MFCNFLFVARLTSFPLQNNPTNIKYATLLCAPVLLFIATKMDRETVEKWKVNDKKLNETAVVLQDTVLGAIGVQQVDRMAERLEKAKNVTKKEMAETIADFFSLTSKFLSHIKTINPVIDSGIQKCEAFADYSNILDKIDENLGNWKEEIVNGVKENLTLNNELDVPKIITETVEKSERKWSDLFASSKDEMKKQSQEAKKQSKLVEKSILESKQRQAVENIERQKRVRNVVIRNVPETSPADSEEQKRLDKAFLLENLDINDGDICSVYRVGKVKDGSQRILVGVLSSPELAKQQHSYGRGRPIYDENNRISYWVNPDLIKSDRVANYNLRIKRRESPRDSAENFRTQTVMVQGTPTGDR